MYPRECPTKSRIKTYSLVMLRMARFYKNASLYQHFNPLKMEFLFAIIIGFIGTAVSYSTFWGAVAFFLYSELSHGVMTKLLFFLFAFCFGIYIFVFLTLCYMLVMSFLKD